tara:strand:- start:505 stop:1248 length:744 start_codon:yes stop_codon:yes gene_type:complete
MKKIIYLFFITTSIFLSSCSSDDSSENNNQPSENLLLSQLIVGYDDGTSYIVNFSYEDDRLVGTSDNDGYEEVYTYTNNLLSRIDEYQDGTLERYGEFEYDSQNRLIEETYSFENTVIQSNNYSYDEQGVITMTDDWGEYDYVLNDDGDIIEEIDVNGNQDYIYTYDNQFNPFINLHQRETLNLISGGFSMTMHNVTSSTNTSGASVTDDFTTTYTYNSQGFPVSGTTVYEPGTVNEETETLQFIYN